MRWICAVFWVFLPLTGLSANDDPTRYIYATYFNCDAALEAAADKTFAKYLQPVYQGSLEAGEISGWGFLKHHSGGNWRRGIYFMGSDVAGLLRIGDMIGERIDKKLKPRSDYLAKACHSHDDYIWQTQAGNVSETRGKVGLSVYMICNIAKETRADELVENIFAPVYQKQLSSGQLTSWGWSSHVLGGKYRRLSTMTAESVDQLFTARAEILNEIAGSDAAREFSSICTSHQDYLWNIAAEGRKKSE